MINYVARFVYGCKKRWKHVTCDTYMRRTMGLASRVYLISRKARFSRALFVIVTSEKRSWCRRTYRPVCRGMQRVNLRETRTENETGKFRAPFDVCHINQKAFLPNDKYVCHFFFHNVTQARGWVYRPVTCCAQLLALRTFQCITLIRFSARMQSSS